MNQHLDKWQLYNVEHKLFPLLLDYLNVNFFAIDKEGFYIYRNSPLTGIVGETEKAPDDEGWRTCKEVIKTGIPIKIEEEQDGKWYLSIKKPLLDDTGTLIGVIGVSIDITDKKRAEELKTKQEILQKALTFANLMAGSMAHELRTPFQQINSHIDLVEGILTSEKQTQEEKYSFLRTIIKTVKKIVMDSKDMIDDMMTKIRSFTAGELPKHSFEERLILMDVEGFLENYPFEQGQKELVKVTYGARFKYMGSKTLTTNILNNLVKNALHAIKETDKQDANISIETTTNDKFNQLIITDTATGVTEDFLSKMFDPFETKRSTQGGTGLGLALCKMIMQDYGGDITCESKLGEYTRFILDFPKL